MRIKFKAPDPRAGTVAQMDSIRGRELVEAGAADEVREDGSPKAEPLANPSEAAGTASSASPVARVSKQTTAKPSAGGAKPKKAAPSSSSTPRSA
jgi:hypothetical protein